MESPLSGTEKKHLRGKAQRLKPVVFVGRAGLSPSVLTEIETALERDGLIKIKSETGREALDQLVNQIEADTRAVCVGTVGRTASFFRQPPGDFNDFRMR
ncbi:MAG: YhbY family RNA-binding protein [Opitutales bacterium]